MPAVSHAVSTPNVCWVLREDPELAQVCPRLLPKSEEFSIDLLPLFVLTQLPE